MIDRLVDIASRYRAYIYVILTVLTVIGYFYTNPPMFSSPARAQIVVTLGEFQAMQQSNRIDHARIEAKIDRLLLILVSKK